MKYRILKIVKINNVEAGRQLTELEFDDAYEALDFCKFVMAAESRPDRRAGVEYRVCPLL